MHRRGIVPRSWSVALPFIMACVSLCLSGGAHAQDTTSVLYDGNYNVLGGTTITASAAVPEGWEPVNDAVTFVYDPDFHFFMRGYYTDPGLDDRDLYRDYGYVVVYAAGDPGGNYANRPDWISHEDFAASFADGQVELSYRYGASYVPTRRGYQSFLIYANLQKSTPSADLTVYDDALQFGGSRYLLTGDGPEQGVVLNLADADPAQGERAISVSTERETAGSHWKLMLFANGAAAGFDGIDVSAYTQLVFYAKASQDVVLEGGFGTADDSGQVSFGPLALTTSYQRFAFDLSAIDRSDVNTLLWVTLHKAHNPRDFTGLRVSIDGVVLESGVALQSSSIVVDQAGDSETGLCTADGSSGGACNLRAAVALANTLPTATTIQLTTDSVITSGTLSVTSPALSIAGAHTISSAGYSRLFDVQDGASLALSQLTIEGFSAWEAGAILNRGELVLDGVRIVDNTARCSGVGAMTAFASCFGGAIINWSTLTLRGDTLFTGNVALATASTASFTTSQTGGGAIANYGNLVIDGPTSFVANTADATSQSGYHGAMPGGASASSSGGAILHGSTGSLVVTGAGIGACRFEGNAAVASASATQDHPVSSASSGGAIQAYGPLTIPEGACLFVGNTADVDPGVSLPN